MEALETTQSEQVTPFGTHEEEAIASLIVDHPEFFSSIVKFLKFELFKRLEVQYVIAQILDYYHEFDVFPTRGMLVDAIKKKLTVDSFKYEEIVAIAQRKSDPREIPAIKGRLMEWAKSRAYGLLYDPDTIARYNNGDFAAVEEVFEQARNVKDIGTNTLWFFDELEKLFDEEQIERFTTGFKQLDAYMHPTASGGGPSRKESLIWMAPTGVGKCHTLESKIIEKKLSQIVEIELENGQIIKLAGFREIQTARGAVRVCDLTEADDIIEIPIIEDAGDISMPALWVSSRP